MEQLTFDSRSLSTSDGFDAYDALYRIGADVARAPGQFHASIAARRFSQLLVFERTLSGLSHERTRQRAGSDGFEHATVQLILAGRLGVSVGDERKWVGAGDMVAFDMRQPQRTWTDGAHYVTVSVARDLLDQTLPAAADFHGRILAGATEPALRDNIRLLAGCDEAPDPTMAGVVASSMGAMLGAILGRDAAASRAAVANAVSRRKAVRFIRANLAHVDLSADLIARRIGVSRSVLYRMFEANGGVSRSIKRERLLAMRRALSSPSGTWSISRVTKDCGFTSNAHASRSFRDEFGIAPGTYRVARRGIETSGGFSHWFDDFA